MNFEDAPVIPTTTIFREARVSAVRGRAVVRELVEAGRISPVSTSTRRDYLTPPHGRVLFEELASSPQ